MNVCRIPPSLTQEIDDLEERVQQFHRGALSSKALKAYRVPFGVYEQRTSGTYMVRIRCAAGCITPQQLHGVAVLARDFGSGRLHITTRQELQIHDVQLTDIAGIMRQLVGLGLSTRGGGGNTVRNITAPADAGIAHNECFDVSMHAKELTSRLTAQGDSWLLPRKLKIAFSHNEQDTAYATVNDLGFVAREKEGVRGFGVYVAGGMGRAAQVGHLLHDFIPEGEVYIIAEAVKQLFSAGGNRRNRHAARLRYLWNQLGRQEFTARYQVERNRVIALRPAPFVFSHEAASELLPQAAQEALPATPHFKQWMTRYCTEQQQLGLYQVRLPIFLGDLTTEQAICLANVLATRGSDVLRLTLDQNVLARNLDSAALVELFALLPQITAWWDKPRLYSNAVSCAGASTCQLGICLSRGALTATVDALSQSGVDLESLADFRIHFSGCGNSCGQHHIADLGFAGKAGKCDGQGYPVYTIVAGAQLHATNGTHFAKPVGEVAARSIPEIATILFEHYGQAEQTFSTFAQ